MGRICDETGLTVISVCERLQGIRVEKETTLSWPTRFYSEKANAKDGSVRKMRMKQTQEPTLSKQTTFAQFLYELRFQTPMQRRQ